MKPSLKEQSKLDFQALASMSIQPIKNFDDMPLESLKRLTADKDVFASPPVCGYNPFIYGNDVDSVDVATRIAMVSYISQILMGNALVAPANEGI